MTGDAMVERGSTAVVDEVGTPPQHALRPHSNGLYGHVRAVLDERVSAELSKTCRYASQVIYISATQRDVLYEALDAPCKRSLRSVDEYREPTESHLWPTMVVLDGVLNSSLDIQALLTNLVGKMCRSDRVSLVLYNPYYRWLYHLLDRIGFRRGDPAVTFVTRAGLEGLAAISGWAVVRLRPVGAFPLRILGIGRVIDGLICAIPGLRQIAPVSVATLRPVRPETNVPPLAVLIPARNEKGNIEPALRRLGCLSDVPLQVIFVEGHSTDGTWKEILRVKDAYEGPFEVLAMQQTGKGKADAVRLGSSAATAELLTILDADLTMPPEMLRRFYDAYCAGYGDFCNGSRLVYPMEGQAMPKLNLGGNLVFAKLLSHVLEVRLTDSLCGTKLMRRVDYERMVAWRADFGDFDPFGDFELLFPAAVLGLGIIEVPIRYRDREYGSTNISRFSDGLKLARMTLIGLWKIRMGLSKVRSANPAVGAGGSELA